MPEDLYMAIGRMSVAFSQLEDDLKNLICALLGQDKRTGEIVTCGMRFTTLCTLAKSLFIHKVNDRELRAFFEELMPQVEYCGDGRNGYVHSSWYTHGPLFPYVRSKAAIGNHGHYEEGRQNMGPGDINAFADVIEETSRGVFEILMHLQHKGLTNHLDLGIVLPEKLPRHFRARKKPVKPWTRQRNNT